MDNRLQFCAFVTRSIKLVIFGLISLFPIACSADSHQSEVKSIIVNGQERDYIVYTPESLLPNPPLMLVLHGGLGNAQAMRSNIHMDRIADKNGFIVVYANGVSGRLMRKRRTWNAGTCCGKAVKVNSDDVGYLESIIDQMVNNHHIDSKRVYITGFSNGAMMAYRMACEKPDKIAAIVPISGTLAVTNCDQAKDIPVLHIHGDLDDNVPFNGGIGSRSVSGVKHKSVEETLNILKRNRQCTLSDTSNLNTNIKVSNFNCKNELPVVLYTIHDGGHEWPENASFSASETAWNFVKSFSK